MNEWHANGNGGSGIEDVLFDAAIAGGSAMFATFAATGFSGTLMWAGFVAFGVAFFASLSAARRRTR